MKYPITLFISLVATLYLPAQQSSACACCSDDHRAFDFWLGEWEVFDSTGTRKLGHNLVQLEEDSCTLHELWTSAGSQVTGQSLNAYSSTLGIWRQFWVDNNGNVLELYGNVENGIMTMTNQRPGAEPVQVLNTIRWIPLADGRVRQIWTSTSDGGNTQSLLFDGFYTKIRD